MYEVTLGILPRKLYKYFLYFLLNRNTQPHGDIKQNEKCQRRKRCGNLGLSRPPWSSLACSMVISQRKKVLPNMIFLQPPSYLYPCAHPISTPPHFYSSLSLSLQSPTSQLFRHNTLSSHLFGKKYLSRMKFPTQKSCQVPKKLNK